jgi:hypothetical protein
MSPKQPLESRCLTNKANIRDKTAPLVTSFELGPIIALSPAYRSKSPSSSEPLAYSGGEWSALLDKWSYHNHHYHHSILSYCSW